MAHCNLRPVILMLGVMSMMLSACHAVTPEATPQPTPTPTATPTPAYAAIPGVYLGMFYGVSSPSTALFEQVGKGVAISAVYLNWSKSFSGGLLSANSAMGRITLITWEFMPGQVPGYEGRVLDTILEGQYDAYIDSWAKGLRDFGKPVLLRFGHEMNGNWYPWSGAANGGGETAGFGDPTKPDGPERYVAAYRYIHERFRQQGADNVLWVWCPNAPFDDMVRALGDWNHPAAYYPGDDVVDWLGFDGYNWGASAYGQRFNATWQSFDAIFGDSYAALQAINPEKPILIGEFASTEEGGDKAAWIRDAFAAIRTRYPQIRGLVWFHISKETDWRINSSDAALQAYREAVADPYWLDTWPGMKDE